jgi:hypothetical protein
MTIETLVDNSKTRKNKEVVDGMEMHLCYLRHKKQMLIFMNLMELHFLELFSICQPQSLVQGSWACLLVSKSWGWCLVFLPYIILAELLTEKSIEFVIRFSRAGNLSSYGSLMGDAFGKYGKVSVEICIVIGNTRMLIVYIIIIDETIFFILVF